LDLIDRRARAVVELQKAMRWIATSMTGGEIADVH